MKNRILKILMMLILSIIFLKGNVWAQENRRNLKPFYYDIVALPGDSLQTKVDVFIWVRNNQLQFLKTDSVFTAHYQVNLDAAVNEKKSVLTRDTTLTIVAKTYLNTISRQKDHLTHFPLKLKPQDYVFKMRVLDLNSNLSLHQEEKKTVPAFTPGKLAMGDLMIVRTSNASEILERGIVSPNQVPIQDTLYIYTQIIAPKDSKEVTLDVSLVPENDDTDYALTKKIPIKASPEALFLRLNRSNMVSGKNNLLLKITAGKQSVEQRKILVLTGQNNAYEGRSLDNMINQLAYIADGKVIDQMKKAKGEQKEQLFEDYWRRHNPTPDAKENPLFAEYYDRVEYANEHFGFVKTMGWQTDRGRVYIIYGKPDDIQRDDTSYGTGSYVVWYYNNLNKKFVFWDEYGFGEYQLVSGNF